MDADIGKRIQELQLLEQNLQLSLVQKQTIQIELNEVDNSISELGKSGDDVYRIVGGVMIKSTKSDLLKEMEEKKKLLDLRIKSIEKQEALLENKLEELRKEINDSIQKKS